MEHERTTKAKGILIEQNVDGILASGRVIVGAYIAPSGAKTKIQIGKHRIVIDGAQLKDLANALVDTAEELDEDIRFYGIEAHNGA